MRRCATRSNSSPPRSERSLAPHFTNLDRPVFALVNLPETVKGALFARYSRYSGTRPAALPGGVRRRCAGRRPALRRRGGRARRAALRARLRRLRRRLDRPGRRRPRRLRVGLQHPHQAPAARPPRRLPGAVDPLHPLRQAAARTAATAIYRDERARPRVRRRDGRALRDLLALADRGRGLGGGALAARRRRARGRLAALDPRQGARPAARPAAGGDAQPRRHLRLRPGLRAADHAADGLAAAGGARVRRHDPRASCSR